MSWHNPTQTGCPEAMSWHNPEQTGCPKGMSRHNPEQTGCSKRLNVYNSNQSVSCGTRVTSDKAMKSGIRLRQEACSARAEIGGLAQDLRNM
jgi:hypothetical protein